MLLGRSLIDEHLVNSKNGNSQILYKMNSLRFELTSTDAILSASTNLISDEILKVLLCLQLFKMRHMVSQIVATLVTQLQHM